jgi:hypothetical protein
VILLVFGGSWRVPEYRAGGISLGVVLLIVLLVMYFSGRGP